MADATVTIDGEELTITHADKIMFPQQGWTKLDLVDHYMTCVDGALAGVFGRPTMLKCFPRGAAFLSDGRQSRLAIMGRQQVG